MEWDFKTAEELLSYCEKKNLPISQVMLRRESVLSQTEETEITARMESVFAIMRDSAKQAIEDPKRSVGGLIGGEARKLDQWFQHRMLCGPVLGKAIAYAMGVLEVNASMGLIVAAPTAGASGVLPGLLLALQETYDLPEARVVQALFTASAVGYLAMLNATVAGAVGGCQAEVGVAAAMTAAAAVELMDGSPRQALDAASTVLMNMLGLICDPVGGLVESPCQTRNASGVANALVAAEMALAGVSQLIPLDEMIAAMYAVGRKLPSEFRETALGGCAMTPTGCKYAGTCAASSQ